VADINGLVEYRDFTSDNRRWEGFQHRPGDIFVCTPPKTGTTWTQRIVWSLLWPAGDGPTPVLTVHPWLEARFEPVDRVLRRLERQEHRRSIKTHTPADGIPWFADCQYIFVGRDGRDACMSLANHMASMRPDALAALDESARDEGIEFVTRPDPGDIHAFIDWFLEDGIVFRHVSTFWARRNEPNVLLVHYEDMLRDLDGEMRRIAEFLDVTVADEHWPAVVERCTFAAMKADADAVAPFDLLFVNGGDSFMHKGTNGRWRDVFTDDELARYDAKVRETLPPECAQWLLAGRGAI
jgi:aryl sulfotransferase